MRAAQFAAVLTLLVGGPAWSQVVAPPPAAPGLASPGRIDPRFGALQRALNVVGPGSPYFAREGLPPGTDTSGVAAMLRFDHTLTPAELASLGRAGVRWQEREGELVRVGQVYGAFVEFRAVPTLTGFAGLVYAEVAWHPMMLQPLDVTGAEIAAVRTRSMPALDTAGAGAVIGSIDSGVDVLHPHFFRADGGAFAWIDTNDDDEFTPRVDHIDYDRNGTGDFNEVARVLDAATYGPNEELRNDDGALDVQRDWLYVDANQDQSRNVGAAAGFTEFDPGYGEPAFVPDDANRNGVLDLDERVLLLGTSKIERFVTSARTYTRGDDLIQSRDVGFADEFLHGTGVASILVGGHASRPGAGIAPDASVVMYASHMDAPGDGWGEPAQLASIQDALQSQLDVLVHEWTNPYTAPIDGSGNIEEAMLNARAGGVVQVNPVGNLNRSQKHIELEVGAASVGQMQFTVGDGFDFGGQNFPYASLYGSIYWRGATPPTFTLRNPDGAELELTGDASIQAIGPNYVQATLIQSLRGTRQLLLVIWNEDPAQNVVVGDWTVDIAATEPDRFIGRIADAWSGWSVGVYWVGATSGQGTAVYPATADAAFGVAAYGGRHEMPSDGTSPGDLRAFSGRGPRIDGAPIVDIAAPDDPFAAWGVSQGWIDSGAGRSWFITFGGTSGAAPHVAGAVALIRALEPNATPADIEARLLGSARRDAQTGMMLPDAQWGAGKLDVYAAVRGVAARANSAPVARVAFDGSGVSAAASADPDDDELSFRWDLEYDGFWDTDWTTQPRVELADPGNRVMRLEVRDGHGGASGIAFRIASPSAMEPEMEPEPADMGEQDSGVSLDLQPHPCGCASASESATWSLVAVLWFGLRRRRRH